MGGEKPTNKSLQPIWQGSIRSEGAQSFDKGKVSVIGIGRVGSETVVQLAKLGITEVYTLTTNADLDELDREKLATMEILFLTAGLGERISRNLTPRIAEIAKKSDAITIGILAKPFEAKKRVGERASSVLAELQSKCDTVVIIDNSELIELGLPVDEGFKVVGRVLADIIRNVISTISTSNLVDFDLTGFKTMIKHGGIAAIGIGESDSSNRAEEAAINALESPLLNINCAKAKSAAIYVTGDNQMTLDEVNCVRDRLTGMISEDAQILWGASIDPSLQGKIRVTLMMTQANPLERRNFNSIAPHLVNLEPYSEPEKQLPIDFGLDQLENFES
jgi:cell division GTPase FtsZ